MKGSEPLGFRMGLYQASANPTRQSPTLRSVVSFCKKYMSSMNVLLRYEIMRDLASLVVVIRGLRHKQRLCLL